MYFLPRAEINNCNVLIDGIRFYDQPANDLIKQYNEVRNVSTGPRCWLYYRMFVRFAYFKENYRLIAADLSK